MRTDALVSVIIPARNCEATLASTLDCLLRQSDPKWEALIINDSSIDETARVIAEYSKYDNRFRGFSTSCGSAAGARNVGIDFAEGERLLFLDGDDWVADRFLEKMNLALDANPSAIAAYCNFVRVFADDVESPEVGSADIESNPFEAFARRCATAIHSVLIKKAAVQGVGNFDTGLTTCEEWDLWQRVARTGGRWVHVAESLSYYRARSGSLSQNLGQMLEDASKVIARGFSTDARVADTSRRHADGACLKFGNAAEAYAYFVLWCAGADCGRGEYGHLATAALTDLPLRENSLASIVGVLFEALMVGAGIGPAKLAAHWSTCGAPCTDLIEAIGRVGQDPGAARWIQYSLERRILEYDDLHVPRVLGLTMGLRLELGSLRSVRPPPSIDRIYAYLCDGRRVVSVAEIGVLGSLDLASTTRLYEILLHDRKVGQYVRRVSRLRIKVLRELVRLHLIKGHSDGHRYQLYAVRGRISQELGASVGIQAREPRGKNSLSANVTREVYWEEFFKRENPWNYDSGYEVEKFDKQLALLPATGIDRALEVGCAEGHFTFRLASRVNRLLAVDISSTAIQRARSRCAGANNVSFARLDLSTDEIPKGMDLIICSEVLYYLGDVDELRSVLERIADALSAGAYLMICHSFVLKDNIRQTGFDWAHQYGAETISRAAGELPGLRPVASIATELYRVDLFKRLSATEREPVPSATFERIKSPIEPDVARKIVWGGAAALRSEVARSERRRHAAVLMYHRIADHGPEALSRYRVNSSTFRRQIAWLRQNGFHSVNSEQLAWFVENKEPFVGRPVMITFDDGYEDFVQHAWPVLRENDFAAEVFVVTGRTGESADWDAACGSPAPLMNIADIRALEAQGISFGSHLMTHTDADRLATSELANELLRSRVQLESWIGKPVRSIAAPFGRGGQRLRVLASECGYKTLFNTVSRAVTLDDDLLDLPRIEVRGEWDFEQFVNSMKSVL